MQADKVTRNAAGKMVTRILFGQPVECNQVSGYEIHIGQTIYLEDATHFASLSADSAEKKDGCISIDTRIFGTYLHGLFDDDAFRHQFLVAARAFHQLDAPRDLLLWKQLREESLNRLASEVEKALDMKTIFAWIGLAYKNAIQTKPDLGHSQREDVAQ